MAFHAVPLLETARLRNRGVAYLVGRRAAFDTAACTRDSGRACAACDHSGNPAAAPLPGLRDLLGNGGFGRLQDRGAQDRGWRWACPTVDDIVWAHERASAWALAKIRRYGSPLSCACVMEATLALDERAADLRQRIESGRLVLRGVA